MSWTIVKVNIDTSDKVEIIVDCQGQDHGQGQIEVNININDKVHVRFIVEVKVMNWSKKFTRDIFRIYQQNNRILFIYFMYIQYIYYLELHCV